MENNLEILKVWKNSLSCYQKLNINEAKELYKKSIESTTKNNYMNELIMETLYYKCLLISMSIMQDYSVKFFTFPISLSLFPQFLYIYVYHIFDLFF